MLLELLQLLAHCLGNFQRCTCQLLQQLGTAAPPPATGVKGNSNVIVGVTVARRGLCMQVAPGT
jgi:hypothetical protein